MKKIIFLLVLNIQSFCILLAEEHHMEYVQHLTIADNLSHNGVTSICEDSKGYLWFGTYDGLSRYDGYNFKVYKNTVSTNLFVSNRIRTVAEDLKGNLWIGTDEGISIYKYSQEKFEDLYSNILINKGISGPIIRKILFNKKKGIVLCATESNGILVFNDDYSFSSQFIPVDDPSGKEIQFMDGIAIDDVNYLFSSRVGLILFNIENHTFKRVLEADIENHGTVLIIDDKTILTTTANGIAILNYKAIGSTYTFELVSKYFEKDKFVNAAIDNFGHLWLGMATKGIVHIDNVNSLINKVPINQTTYNVNSGMLRISNIVTSSNSGCWVGTFNKGIFRFDLDEKPFRKNPDNSDYDFNIHSNKVMHISAWDKDRFYVTAQQGGLALFNTQNHRFEPIQFQIAKKDASKVLAVFVDSNKNIWLNCSNELGFCRIRKESPKYRENNSPKSSFF